MASSSARSSDASPLDGGGRVVRFCPRCRRARKVEAHVRLCKDCGESLQDRGYCPICESFVNQAVGDRCAKHDVPLEAEAAAPPPAEFAARDWVTLGSYPSRSAADALRIRLEAEGIPTFLDGERMGSAAMYQVATGGVKLQVPADSLDEARILVAQSWAPAVDDPDGLDDAWDELAPEPGARLHGVMELMMLGFAALVALPVVGLAVVRLLTRLFN